jgi:hypothetical protein
VSFSRLLLAAANSRKFIVGEGIDKIVVSPRGNSANRDPFEGEVVLCFQLDDRRDGEKRVARSLGFQPNDSRCDGLIFYAHDTEDSRVICLVEMKSTNLGNAGDQIIQTKRHLEGLLREECYVLPQECQEDCERQITRIKWKACLFHHGSSQSDVQNILRQLKSKGFSDVRAYTSADNDARQLLVSEISARDMGRKYKGGKGKHR